MVEGSLGLAVGSSMTHVVRPMRRSKIRCKPISLPQATSGADRLCLFEAADASSKAREDSDIGGATD